MARFAGIKNNNIYIVSDYPFTHDEFDIVEVDSSLDHVPSREIVSDYKFKFNKIVAKKPHNTTKGLRVAFVSNWKMRCGIATYSEFLYTELVKEVGDFKLFIEHNAAPTGPLNEMGGETFSEDKIVSCWKRGESSLDLVKKLKEYDPDVILIQHEFGLWPNACYWISLMNQLSEYRVIVTMHSVFHHKDKTICEAAMPEIVVHLDGAKTLLKEEKGIPGEVHVIPHGCFPCLDRNKLWNFYKSDHTFMQFGFGFEYKGYENSIKTVSILKEKYPDVFFTGLFSEAPQNKLIHQIYYLQLMELVEKLGIQENIGIIRGFQSEQSLDAYLRTNKVAIFPYVSHPAHEVWGASGAARFAMTKNIPIITSSVNHFSDLVSIKADTPEEMAQKIDDLFSNQSAIEKQLLIQDRYMNETTWTKVARKYLDIFEK